MRKFVVLVAGLLMLANASIAQQAVTPPTTVAQQTAAPAGSGGAGGAGGAGATGAALGGMTGAAIAIGVVIVAAVIAASSGGDGATATCAAIECAPGGTATGTR